MTDLYHGGRIDPKTGRLAKDHDTKVDTNNDTKNVALTSMSIAARLRVSVSTIKRDMKILRKLGLVEHVGPSNGGYWKRLK